MGRIRHLIKKIEPEITPSDDCFLQRSRRRRRRGLEAGADYYLAKASFHDEALLQAVINLIGEATE
jgi:hypothetical protein